MATLATQQVVAAGLNPTYAACAGGGDNFTPDQDTMLHVKNGSGGALTVTVGIPAKYHGQTVTSISVSVPAAGERMIGPFPADAFADPANSGLAAITYSGVTSLTIGVFKTQPY